jgi:hypothetical protein
MVFLFFIFIFYFLCSISLFIIIVNLTIFRPLLIKPFSAKPAKRRINPDPYLHLTNEFPPAETLKQDEDILAE